MRTVRLPLRILLALIALLASACGGPREPSPRPMPSWFALGPEVKRLSEARALQRSILSLGTQPRWFTGFPRRATADDDVLRPPGVSRLHARDPDGHPLVATIPDLPDTLDELQRTSLGTSLALSARLLAPSRDLELTITLRAGTRAVWRESEHRWTNTVPFLFGLYADASPVRRAWEGAAKSGGLSRFVELAEAHGRRTWVLRVARSSLDRLLGPLRPASVALVAAFAERQHAGHAVPGHVLPDESVERPFPGPQIVVRSNLVTLPWD